MKTTLLISIVSLMSVSLFAATSDEPYSIKDGAVVVEKVIPFSVTLSEASRAVNSWFVIHLNDSNETLKNNSDDYYVAKIRTSILKNHSMGMWHTMGELTIEVRFKEDRMKVAVSCNSIINENINGTNRLLYSPLDAAPLSEKHNATRTGILKKDAEETFNNLIIFMNGVVSDIENTVSSAKEDDDW